MKKLGHENLGEMNRKISEIMKTDVYTVNDDATIKEVLQVLVDKKISGVPIVNKNYQVVGFISDGDIMKFIAKQNPRIIDMTSFITVWYDTESFEKKLHDLEMSRMVSIQMGPQTRMLQNNDVMMIEKIQSSLVNTIPLWKSQMVLALGLENARKATAAQAAVSEMTNELLKKNAEKLKQGSIDIAKEAERSIIDIETLQHTNEQLISTLDEVMQIQRDGAQKRQEAEAELRRIEGELKAKLTELR
jgi:uncharacterized protein YaaN involved in tellurite resistance